MNCNNKVLQILSDLIVRYPMLKSCEAEILDSFNLIYESYRLNGTLICAGNGGSSADCDHITGELLKSFKIKRSICDDFNNDFKQAFPEDFDKITSSLEGALPAISLPSMSCVTSAFANDVDSSMVFAQLIYGLGNQNDVFLAISTSGNSANIVNAIKVAKVKKIKTIGLTGVTGGECVKYCDVCIKVPEEETYKIQELHLPIYHALCSMLEIAFFDNN